MRAPYTWLKKYCDPSIGPDELAERLAMTGTEVERVTHVGVPAENGNTGLFYVGKVMTVEPHPNADRLRVCFVDVGEGNARTIVCGAPNVAEGQFVAVALPGSVLANGTRLKQAELRGVVSEGMILSEEELGLGQDCEGIMALEGDLQPGNELNEIFSLGDDVLELEVTPNRPDCLSIYGVAREVHAITGAELKGPPGADEFDDGTAGKVEDFIRVIVEDRELCPRFTARAFTDVKVGPSPLWLKARLIALGQRPINNVVDITNYVMFLTGQPMHAYDLDKTSGQELVVRRAVEGETLRTLDGELRAFDSDAVLVCDAAGPNGIGGIMGGAASEVSESTTRVLLEAANWHGPNILKTSSKLQLRSEASTRFEKQLHPALALEAQVVASKLMHEICAAKSAAGTVDIYDEPPPRKLTLSNVKLSGLLGEEIGAAQAKAILERLGFHAKEKKAGLEVLVPPHRYFDVVREADLIEEVARIHGLDKLPATLPSRREAVGGLTKRQQLRRMAEDAMRFMGFSEAICWSFISPSFCDRLMLPANDERRKFLQLENPLSEEQSVMRTTLLPGLLDVARHNFNVHMEQVRLFESGRVFMSRGQTELASEHHNLAALMAGSSRGGSWRTNAAKPDFYLAKSTLETLLSEMGTDWSLAAGGPSFLHPGRAAQVLSHGREVGWIGELHPLVVSAWEIDHTVSAFELDLTLALRKVPFEAQYVDLMTYPAIYQDIAVVTDEEIEAQTVIETVHSGAGEELASARVFDIFKGEQLEPGKKSIALRLEFRSTERTLTDGDVRQMRQEIRAELEKELGASLRE